MATPATNPKPLSIHEVFSTPTVTIKIGPDETPYHISKSLIMHYSGYFRGAFGSANFEEGATNESHLPDVTPSVFEVFVEWLYTNASTGFISDVSNFINENASFSLLAELYIFADRFLVAGLKEFILMKAQIFAHKDGVNSIDYETIAFVFNSLPDDDSFLHLVVDLHCRTWTEEFHSEMEKKGPHLDQLPAAFLAKTIGVLVKKRKIDDMQKGSCRGENQDSIKKTRRELIEEGQVIERRQSANFRGKCESSGLRRPPQLPFLRDQERDKST